LDIDLFTHPAIKQKIVVARNAYGDDTDRILDVFYKKGIRQIVYLGLAGAVADYRVGDVVIPKAFTDRHYNTVPFEQNFAGAYQSELAQLVNVRPGKTQGWVQSLFDETKDVLLDWRENSVVSVDVEGLYLAKFAKAHSDLRIAALFVISDETLGDITIEESNAFRGVIDESVGKLISVLFSRLMSQSNP
jgi:uridine phosphorylase